MNVHEPLPPADVNETVVRSVPALSWFRRILFVVCLAGATAAGYFAFPRPKAVPPAPGFYAQSRFCDVGERGQGEFVPVTFKLTNRYAESVEIISVNSGCSCLVPTVSHKHLAPGQEATVSLNWHTGTRRGTVSEAVWVFHSVPGNPPDVGGRMQLAITGEVVPDIRLDPARVQFAYGQSGTVRVALSPGRLATFKVHDVYTNSQALSVKYLPDASAVEVTYTPKGELDTGSGLHVAVKTTSANAPTMHIPVTITKP